MTAVKELAQTLYNSWDSFTAEQADAILELIAKAKMYEEMEYKKENK